MKSPSPASRAPLKTWVLACYAAPAAPLAALGLPIVVFLPVYYERAMGIEIATVGLVFMLARFWDVFTDPIAGAIEDRTGLSFGRRRFWLLVSAPITAFGAYLVFFPPQGAGAPYLILAMFALYVGYTLTTVAHLSWGAEIAGSLRERSRVQGWREFYLVAGMLTVLAAPSVMGQLGLGGFSQAVQAMGLFVIIGLPLAAALVVSTVPEPPRANVKPASWIKTIPALAGNRHLRIVLLSDLITGIGTGVLGSLFVYYFENYLGFSNAGALTLLFFYFTAGLAAVPLWLALTYRVGKVNAFTFAMTFSTIGCFILAIIPSGNFVIAAAALLIVGLPYGAGPFLMRAIMADVNEDDMQQNGDSRAGILFSLLIMSSKFGLAMAAGTTFTILGMAGFASDEGHVNSNHALSVLRWTYILMPAIAFALAAVVMRAFSLEMELARREQGESTHV